MFLLFCNTNSGHSDLRAPRDKPKQALITPLEPRNPPLYQIQVFLSPKRVSSCEGVNYTSLSSVVGNINIYFEVYDHSFLGGFGQEFFPVSASVCDSRNWNSRSNSFARAPSSGDGSNAPRSAYPFRTWPGSGTWAERDKREVRTFLYSGRHTPELFLDLGICRC